MSSYSCVLVKYFVLNFVIVSILEYVAADLNNRLVVKSAFTVLNIFE